MTDATSPHKDGGSNPSGVNWDDYVWWCLSAMYNSEQCTAQSALAFQESNEEVRNLARERTAPSDKSNTSAMTSIVLNNNGDSDDFAHATSTRMSKQQDEQQQHNEDGVPLSTTFLSS